MKKVRGLVIGGIETRIFNLVIITVIVLTVAFVGLNAYQADLSAKSTGEVTGQAVNVSLGRITGLRAENVDAMFRDLRSQVTLVAEYAAIVFDHADQFPEASWALPDPAGEGTLTAMVIPAEGVDPHDSQVASVLGLVANMRNMMISVCETFGTDSVYMGLPERVHYSVSPFSAEWYDETGNLTSYDPTSRYWYKQAAEAGGLVFTDVEEDVTTHRLSITCAMPVYDGTGALRAVVGADLYLDAMRDWISQSDAEGAFVLIVNRDGHVIFAPADRAALFAARTSGEAADLRQSDNAALAALVTDGMASATDVRTVELAGESWYMAAAPVPTTGWTMLIAYSRDLADQPLRTYEQSIASARRWMMGILLAIAALTLGVALLVGKRIVRPLNAMTKAVTELGEGNPVFRMEDTYRTGDEIEALAESFAEISRRTVEYIGQVRTVTAEKERIGTELRMANQIQESMLPSVFPAFPGRPEFDIYATMDPAREVGGDFYDFFLIDDDHLALLIADVSGKGVPAALFMMIAKTIIRDCAMLGRSAAETMARTNEAFCANNRMQMFVTVWLGILEISTGRMTAANAGHEYPAVDRGNGFELLKDRHGFVLGGMEGVRYREYELDMKPGDRLFVYTDGVPEATDAENGMFGTDRMLQALNAAPAAAPEEVLNSVRRAVDDFVNGAEQFDDLTMMCLEYKGPANS